MTRLAGIFGMQEGLGGTAEESSWGGKLEEV